MSKSLRALSVLLFLVASFAFASTPDNGAYLGDGMGPQPQCTPWYCGQ
jgi:hypothetical protein